MMRRLIGAVFAAVVLSGLGAAFGTASVSADGERTTISPWRGEQHVYRLVEGWNFAANHPMRLFVSSPAREQLREINNEGLMTGPDGSIWFRILPGAAFGMGDLTNGVWQLRVCANVCHDLTLFIGGSPPFIATGMPARLCTPTITPFANFPTFGPPGWALHPSGYTYNEIVQYCGPTVTPWIPFDPALFPLPVDWYPGYPMPNWPYPWMYPWDPTLFPLMPGQFLPPIGEIPPATGPLAPPFGPPPGGPVLPYYP
jgi:hypothetical protein